MVSVCILIPHMTYTHILYNTYLLCKTNKTMCIQLNFRFNKHKSPNSDEHLIECDVWLYGIGEKKNIIKYITHFK